MNACILANGVEITSDGKTFWLPADEARALKRWLIDHDLDLWEIIDAQLKRADVQGQAEQEGKG